MSDEQRKRRKGENTDYPNDGGVGGQNPIWPGEQPTAPKPGTVTPGPQDGEQTIIPVVR